MDKSTLAARKSAHVFGEVSHLSKDEVTIALGDLVNATVLGQKDDGTFIALDIAGGATEATVAAGVLFGNVDASVTPAPGLAHTRLTSVDGAKLVWPVGITAQDKATAIAELKALQIIVR